MVEPSLHAEPGEAGLPAWLLRLALARFPGRPALADVVLPPNLAEAWMLVASLAGITPQDLAALVADASGLALAPRGAPDPALAKLLPESMARRHGVAPVALDDGRLVVAVATPDISQALQELRFAAGGRTVEARIAAPEDIEAARVALYGATPRSAASQHGRILDLDDEGAETLSGDAQLVRFCRALVRQAIARRASDIHIHPLAGTGVVRLRIDGRLVRVASISLTVMAAVIRLLKAQGGMDSTNAMVPQDGRASLTYQRRRYDLRISTLPASGAESLVMRLLDQSRTFDLEHTNFAPWALEALRRLASNANGLVLITGPTGSGKTSTLYSLLAALNKTTRRIITVEEPLEYELDGLTQVEVNNAAGVTFQRALRSILRQDPDVLLIGEIRDAETAQIAVQAALTGHLVFSTLHTQDAVRAIPRLVDLGVAPELLADTLLGVVSQRLMRQLCPHCKTACAAPLRPIESLFEQVTGAPPGARAVGCKHCDHTGYHGRFPVVEALEIPDTMRSQLLRGNSDGDALAAAIPGHWRSIESNAANWVISGLTTPDEAFESLGLRLWTTLARKAGVDAPIAALLGSSESVGTQGASQATALIISTNVPMAGVLCARLEQLGQVPLVVDSPLAASQALQSEHHLQLLVVDITEPDPQRRAYAQELRASLAWSGLRTLVIYDGAEAGIVERMEAFGMRSFLPAPLDEAAFEQRVAQLISEG